MTRRTLALALALPLVALGAAGPAAAHGDSGHGGGGGGGGQSHQGRGAEVYQVRLTELNDSGVSGKATLVVRDGTVRVRLVARGLVPDMAHPQHIHGLATGDATCPPAAADVDDDGVLTIGEGLPFYGNVLQGFETQMAERGRINYHDTFDVTGDLLVLDDEVVVVHGGYVNGEYVPSLPVACGEIR